MQLQRLIYFTRQQNTIKVIHELQRISVDDLAKIQGSGMEVTCSIKYAL